jgi:predicted acylesterase/phospholipase RssA
MPLYRDALILIRGGGLDLIVRVNENIKCSFLIGYRRFSDELVPVVPCGTPMLSSSVLMDGKKLLKCDIVMQGGVTSGVVYPGLVCKLAEDYQFQSIGGTSAGAIAASLTAAAEFARRNGNPDAFDKVAAVSGWLGTDSYGTGSNLFSLFQPQPETKGLFQFAVAFLVKSWSKRISAWLSLFWPEIVLGLTPSVVLSLLASGTRPWLAVAYFLAFVVGVCGVAVAMVIGLLIRLARLPKQWFGLCTGSGVASNGQPEALVPWLHGQINAIAGRSEGEPPLTFGDLGRAGITLRMMTTCLTWGRPYTLPFTTKVFYYSPNEFRNFFPEDVVKWMEDHPSPGDADSIEVNVRELRRLPDSNDLPVIVAARMSLSFPFLFCAVPLYSLDWTLRERAKDEVPPAQQAPGGSIAHGDMPPPENVWFADGGICNNFPLHLFDVPVPRWPTFGVDLTEVRSDRPPGGDRVSMPKSNRGGINPSWTRLTAKSGLAGTFGLAASIIDTARNWVNNLQAVVPGYRDRIVHIALTKDEGGLNLTMPLETLTNLSQYGRDAGQRLIDHFIKGEDCGHPTTMTWSNQRWIRYRSTLSLLETFLADFAHGMDNPEPGDPSYSELIARAVAQHAPSYPLDSAQKAIIEIETEDLIVLGRRLSGRVMKPDSPRPEPELLIRPSF